MSNVGWYYFQHEGQGLYYKWFGNGRGKPRALRTRGPRAIMNDYLSLNLDELIEKLKAERELFPEDSAPLVYLDTLYNYDDGPGSPILVVDGEREASEEELASVLAHEKNERELKRAFRERQEQKDREEYERLRAKFGEK